ncbi:D-alanine-D-alanine ligase [Methanoculleus chikugoensis]|jgi:D-alanine-D-alanine ligase|uniref:D-alanine-D-alanine ligase n=1 Tax=Methanoculleus chikugoensis TaxID=118126 RepID=A0A1M4MMY7_9EURY|nr:methyltransferase domain-containing protein [Methanoculleus chikugoensis]MDD4566452.1 methyltransferase domain-containing protein [Methanoculleus chikugoensis]NMA09894.1 methyltransferase domain-containing protein [Methanomicrobiales archaeon]SCL76243.1 D-alanine-D-alanine ligase [Methanoculleus chikugoensis]
MIDEVNTDEPPDSRRKAKHRDKRTFGPVPNLEEHVKPDWWRGIFNRLYLKTDGDVVDDPGITEREIDRIARVLHLQPHERVLDLCCGQGRHTLELARRGYNVEGLDQSHYLIQRARSTAKKEGLPIRFREGDARRLPYRTDTYDVVLILGNSFGYFDSVEEDLRILTEIRRILKPWGRLLLDVADGEYLREHFQPRSWEWIDDGMFVCRERSLSFDEQRLISREVITDVEKGVVADQFYAEHLYTPEALRRLLERAGFSGIAFQEIATESQRNQDLGMMERRHIVTAHVRKEWSATKTKGRETAKHVAVLLGDPARPDALKPSCAFDDDDFYTIDQMKAALRELSGYRFTYLSKHETLIQDLPRLKGKVDYVFNLCDEGFNNDPRKELHVPALLEMYGIPYTGAGPQSLAFCYDKSLVRGIAKEMGIPVPDACFITPGDRTYDVGMKFPAIVKPNAGDSSYGITQKSIAQTIEELSDIITSLRTTLGYDCSLLVEEFLTGKDISVGIIGNPSGYSMVLPVIEEDYSALPPDLPRICGYEAKWLPDSPYWKVTSKPADLPEGTEKMIVRCCLALFERLECRDYCRFDWRLDEHGNPKLLEVNPNPGWCWDGHLARMAKYAGLNYSEMLGRILKAAEERFGMEPERDTRETGKERLPFDLSQETA